MLYRLSLNGLDSCEILGFEAEEGRYWRLRHSLDRGIEEEGGWVDKQWRGVKDE